MPALSPSHPGRPRRCALPTCRTAEADRGLWLAAQALGQCRSLAGVAFYGGGAPPGAAPLAASARPPLPRLQELQAPGCLQLGDSSLAALLSSPQLVSANLNGCSQLRLLRLEPPTPAPPAATSGVAVSANASPSALRHLDVSGCRNLQRISIAAPDASLLRCASLCNTSAAKPPLRGLYWFAAYPVRWLVSFCCAALAICLNPRHLLEPSPSASTLAICLKPCTCLPALHSSYAISSFRGAAFRQLLGARLCSTAAFL